MQNSASLQNTEPKQEPEKYRISGSTASVITVSPLQNRAIGYLQNSYTHTATSVEMAKSFGTRSQAVGACLKQLARKGIVQKLDRGLWELYPEKLGEIHVKKPTSGKKNPKTAVRPAEELAMGTLFESVGKDNEGTLVVRSLDDHRLYRMTAI